MERVEDLGSVLPSFVVKKKGQGFKKPLVAWTIEGEAVKLTYVLREQHGLSTWMEVGEPGKIINFCVDYDPKVAVLVVLSV